MKKEKIRPLAKPTSNKQVGETYEAQNRSVLNVREDSSIGVTNQLEVRGELSKRSIKLPNDVSEQDYTQSCIRVNHAGEYGAKRIYQGQLAFTKNSQDKNLIKHMQEQEEVHLKFFENEIAARKVRPSLLYPVWHIGGFALGAITAIMGKHAAMACTEAVEEVINEHYLEQLDKLPESEQELKENIEKFRQEELEHRDIAVNHGSQNTKMHQTLTKTIKTISKISIFLAKKI
jgi:3-demethoxyubiquinol 3-hydroxylase